MRILKFLQGEEGELNAEVESLEDLWLLSRLVEKGDKIEGTSFRRVKALDLQRADSGEKKPVRLLLEVSQVEFAEAANSLRVTGKILSAHPEEFAQVGQFHTLDLELRSRFKLLKHFQLYHRTLLEEARRKARQPRALIVVMDERQALFSALQQNGIRFLFTVDNEANKRDPKTFQELQQEYFAEILKALEERQAERTVLAGPGFAKDEFKRYAEQKNPRLVKALWFEHASSAEKSAVYELLKQGLLQKVVEGQKVQEEFMALEALKKSLGKGDGLAVYGLEQVRGALSMGAVDTLMVSDALLRSDKSLNALLEQGDRLKAKLLIFNSDDDAGREFSAFQLAALLRFKLAY